MDVALFEMNQFKYFMLLLYIPYKRMICWLSSLKNDYESTNRIIIRTPLRLIGLLRSFPKDVSTSFIQSLSRFNMLL